MHRKLNKNRNKFIIYYEVLNWLAQPNIHQNIFPKFKWQKSFHDHYIRGRKDFENHLKYIYNNPIKHKICDPEKYQFLYINYPKLINEF